jgi:hypothetical protein
MPSSDKDKLLDDLIRDANYEAFRADSYGLGLDEFRFRRTRKSKSVLLALAAVIVVGGFLILAFRTPKEVEREKDILTGLFQPDQGAMLATVDTVPLQHPESIRSVPERALVLETAASSLDLVRSDRSTVNAVTDAELFAVLPRTSVGFVRTPQGTTMFFGYRKISP